MTTPSHKKHIVVRLRGNSKDGVIIDVRVSTALNFRNSSSIERRQPCKIADQDDNPDFVDEEQGRTAKRFKSTAMTETWYSGMWRTTVNHYPLLGRGPKVFRGWGNEIVSEYLP